MHASVRWQLALASYRGSLASLVRLVSSPSPPSAERWLHVEVHGQFPFTRRRAARARAGPPVRPYHRRWHVAARHVSGRANCAFDTVIGLCKQTRNVLYALTALRVAPRPAKLRLRVASLPEASMQRSHHGSHQHHGCSWSCSQCPQARTRGYGIHRLTCTTCTFTVDLPQPFHSR